MRLRCREADGAARLTATLTILLAAPAFWQISGHFQRITRPRPAPIRQTRSSSPPPSIESGLRAAAKPPSPPPALDASVPTGAPAPALPDLGGQLALPPGELRESRSELPDELTVAAARALSVSQNQSQPSAAAAAESPLRAELQYGVPALTYPAGATIPLHVSLNRPARLLLLRVDAGGHASRVPLPTADGGPLRAARLELSLTAADADGYETILLLATDWPPSAADAGAALEALAEASLPKSAWQALADLLKSPPAPHPRLSAADKARWTIAVSAVRVTQPAAPVAADATP